MRPWAIVGAFGVLLAGCGCGDGRDKVDGTCVGDVDLTGVWHGDVQYTTLNDSPYDWKGPTVARFWHDGGNADPDVDVWGAQVEATVDDKPFELVVTQGEVAESGSVTIDHTETWTFTDPYWDDGVMVGDATLTEVYTTTGGGSETYVLTGSVALTEVERLDEAEASGLSLVGEHGAFDASGFPVNVRVRDGVAYLARYEDGLRILDVSDPSAIVELAHAPTEGGGIYNDVKLFEREGQTYAMMASSRAGVVTYDVTDPANPLLVSTWPSAEAWDRYNVHTIWIDEARNLAFLGHVYGENAETEMAGGLDVLDVFDPASPVQVGRWEAADAQGSFVHDLFVGDDGIAYLCAWEAGLVLVDVTDPASMPIVGQFADYDRRTSHSVWVDTIGDRKIAVHGDEDYGAHLRVLDVTDRGAITVLAEWQTRPEVSIHNVMLRGSTAYVAYYQDGVRVLDLSDPSAPTETAYFNTWDPDGETVGQSFYEGAVGIDLVGDLVYVADSERGLLVLQP